MSSYLDQYGVREIRRERLVKRLAISLLVLAAAAGAVYWYFRDYREERQVRTFLQLLREQNYQAAYELWGCTNDQPCPQYSFDKFLEDWGPAAAHGNIAAARVGSTRSCEGGIIQTLRFGPNDEIWLWVDRSNRNLGYAPWPVCNPRVPITREAP
jgi:hypothetical protein